MLTVAEFLDSGHAPPPGSLKPKLNTAIDAIS